MEKFAGFFGMLVGSFAGGWVGGKIGLMSAVILSAIGAGAGFYYGRKLLGD